MSVFTKKFLRLNAAGQGDVLISADTISPFSTTHDVETTVSASVGYQNLDVSVSYNSPSVAVGTNTSVTSNKLIDSSATFITDGVSVGDKVANLRAKQMGTVVSVDSETELTLDFNRFPTLNELYNIYTPDWEMERVLTDGIQKAVSTKWREAIVDVEVPSGITILKIFDMP